MAIVGAGMHQNFKINEFPHAEKMVLKKLSEFWYLTNSGRELEIGTSKYRFIIIKPTSKFQQSFGLEREICLVFSPYENFEPRTLDAFDKALETISSARIDSICRVLVSRDQKICASISALSAQEPGQPTIVPFTYQELMGDKDGAQQFNRFRDFFFSRDIFSVQGPLRNDAFFFGRAKLVQGLIDRFKQGENSGLFGLRKSGKTSIIYSLLRWSHDRDEKVILIDCESPSIHGLRWYQLLERIVLSYHEHKASKIKLPEGDDYTELTAADRFSSEIRRVHSSRKAAQTLIVFDEIEHLSPKTGSSSHWSNGDDFVYFWQSVRSLI
ncbi:ATP-binding protein [Xanthomonas cannabis]|uniref:ATP-binding protein n=1 Tax=Xanthomonas cannabis TaxID=1885674 RepID=UPI0033AE03ED